MATDDALRACLDQWRQGQPMTAHDDRLLTAALDDRAALTEALADLTGDDTHAVMARKRDRERREAVERLAAALRQTVTPWLRFGVRGTCCRWCGALDPLSTGGQSHAADCPAAVLARHDAARQEEGE